MNELINEIKECYDEELIDNKKYSSLIEIAEKHECEQAAKIFKDLADEEYSHAQILHELKMTLEEKIKEEIDE